MSKNITDTYYDVSEKNKPLLFFECGRREAIYSYPFVFLFGKVNLVMAALCNRGPLYFCLVVSFFFVSFFFFFPRLLSAVEDWMSTILPRLSANLECRSEMCCTRLAGNTGCKKSPSGHHRTTFSGFVFATKARSDNQRKTC